MELPNTTNLLWQLGHSFNSPILNPLPALNSCSQQVHKHLLPNLKKLELESKGITAHKQKK